MADSDFLPITTQAVEVLRQAAAKRTTWRQAQSDPKAFLRKRNLSIPADVSITLSDLDIPRSGLVVHSSDIERPKGDDNADSGNSTLRQTNPASRIWWESMYMGCPIGTYPHKTVRKESICVKKGIVKSGFEWIPDNPGSRQGHFEYTKIDVVCLQSLEIELEVIDCLPLIVIKRGDK